MVEFNYTQDQAAERVGKSRSAVANILRLRQLPEPIKASIMEGHLSMGHARALLGADTPAQQKTAWRVVLAKKLSVRETENLIKRLKTGKKEGVQPTVGSPKTYFEALADDLSRYFGTKVQIQRRGQKGKVQIEFYNDADLEQLIGRLRQS